MSGAPIALITGASAGLGAEFARQLSAGGYRLVLTARRKEQLESLAVELGNARAVALDLAAPDSAEALLANIGTAGEHVELLINNAGFGLHGRFARLDAQRQREMIDLNCGTLTDLCRMVTPGMIERRSGGILNVASTAAFQPGPGMAVYFATKAYVLSFTEALHEELKPHGVRVTALCPGPTRTEFGNVAGFTHRRAFDRLSMNTAPVVRAAIRGLEQNRAIVITGLINKIGAQATRLTPRALARKAAGAIRY